MTDHDALVAELRYHHEMTGFPPLAQAADALAALGDTVPENVSPAITIRAEYENTVLAKQLVEARAERDALAHVIDQVRAAYAGTLSDAEFSFAAKNVIDAAPAVSLALHDAEVKAQALDDAREAISTKPAMLALPERFLAARAAAIREEAK